MSPARRRSGLRLDGARAVVTGASRGIGRAIATAFADEGAEVVLCARDGDALQAVVSEIAAGGGIAHALPLDLTDGAAVAHLPTVAAHLLGGAPTILVNNAGVYTGGRFDELTDDDWRRTFELNVFGTARVTRTLLPAMVEAGRGRVISVASTAGKSGTAGQSAYNASKHALLGLTRSLALEVAADGVRVTAICPGWVDTDLIDEQEMAPRLGVEPSEVRATLAARAPIGRMTTVDEVAGMAVYLASPEADSITGVGLTMAGGMLLI